MATAGGPATAGAGWNASDSVRLREFQVVRPDEDGVVAEQVVDQIREMIRQRKLKPGDRVPAGKGAGQMPRH